MSRRVRASMQLDCINAVAAQEPMHPTCTASGGLLGMGTLVR